MKTNGHNHIHKTSTGKMFAMYDKYGNFANYKEHIGLFGRRISELLPGQKMIHKETGFYIIRLDSEKNKLDKF